MPIPKPGKGQTQKEFMDHCMGDDTMNQEYPDRTQRYAICIREWQKSKADAHLTPIVEPKHGRVD